MSLRELLERRSKIVEEMRAITNGPAGEAGDLSGEQSTKFDTLKTELAGVEKKIERQQAVDEAERRMQGTPIHSSGDGQLDAELRKFSLVRAIASQVPDLAARIDCGREREISNELAKRSGMQFNGIAVPMQVFEKRVVITSTAPTGGPGGNLIATEFLASEYTDRLRNALVIRRLGARILSGLVGNVDIPNLKKSAVAHWFAENTPIPASDLEFAAAELRPKHVGAITEFSRNMLLQSTPDIENLVRDDFAQVLAEAVDNAAISGAGGVEPTGLLNLDIDDTVDMSPPTWEGVLQLIERVELGNSEGAGFITDASVVRKLRSTPRVDGMDTMIMESARTLADYPVATTNQLPVDSSGNNRRLVFGKWSDIVLGYWSVLDLLVNPYESTAYAKGNVSVRGIITADIAVRHLESFAAATVDTTPGA